MDVATLHIDSTSFSQIAQVREWNLERMKSYIQEIVILRSKMHNPVTGSGGVLLGTVQHLGFEITLREKCLILRLQSDAVRIVYGEAISCS